MKSLFEPGEIVKTTRTGDSLFVVEHVVRTFSTFGSDQGFIYTLRVHGGRFSDPKRYVHESDVF